MSFYKIQKYSGRTGNNYALINYYFTFIKEKSLFGKNV